MAKHTFKAHSLAIESSLKMKNAFYFNLKALLVIKIFDKQFRKTVYLQRQG